MESAPLTCPFCNARLTAMDSANCPRCGEAIPRRSGATVEASLNGAVATPSQRTLRQRRAVRSLRIALIVGVTFGSIGFASSIIYKRFIAEKPQTETLEAVDAAATVVAPLEMSGLKWLPQGTDTVIALQAAALRESFGAENPPSVPQLLTKAGIPDLIRNIVEKMVAVPLDDVDQVTLGLNAKSGVLLSDWVAVIQVRKPYRIESLAAKAKAEELAESKQGRKLYYAKIPELKLAGGVYWWQATDHVLIATLHPDVMQKNVPNEARETLRHLNEKMVERVGKLLPSDSYGWAHSQSEKYDSLLGFIISTFFDRKDLVKSLADFRAFAMSIRNDNGLVVTSWAETKSEKRATEIRDWLTKNIVKTDDSHSVGGAGATVMLRTVAKGTNVADAFDRIFAK